MGERVVIGAATLYHDEAERIVPTLEPAAELLLTDPPYGIGEAAGKNRTRIGLTLPTDYGVDTWDDRPAADWLMRCLLARTRWQIIFGGHYYALPPTRCVLVWDKDNSGDFADCELAWTNLDKAVRIKRWRWNGMLQENMGRKEPRVHPTQKPLAVIEWALSHAPAEVGTVLDPFMGSGTTGVACVNAGKAFVGIERVRKYFDAACERIAAAAAQGRLFG